jgi:beta-hydroxylase
METALVIIIVFAILIIIIELDRTYSETPYPPSHYYGSSVYKLGPYNTLVRLFHPYHTHVFNPNNFAEHFTMKNNWKDIQTEALNVYSNVNLLNMKDLSNNNFKDIDEIQDQWKVFVIKWYDKPIENAIKLCPRTVEIINKCPNVRAAMFSIIKPGKYIKPHKGPFTGCLRYHLGLSIPSDKENCWIMVNGHKYNWTEGDALIFDDTYTHSVLNNTNETRIILFVDILRPMIFPFNHINRAIVNNVSTADFIKEINNAAEKSVNIDAEIEKKLSNLPSSEIIEKFTDIINREYTIYHV